MSETWKEQKIEHAVDKLIEAHLHNLAIDLKEKLWEDIEGNDTYGSPIEKIMAAALHFASWDYWDKKNILFSPWIGQKGINNKRAENNIIQNVIDDSLISIYSQYPIDKYRADFSIFAGLNAFNFIKKIVVECDGHDFHEKTKEQAARDKKRGEN